MMNDEVPRGRVYSVGTGNDGMIVAAGCGNGDICIWRVEDALEVRRFKFRGSDAVVEVLIDDGSDRIYAKSKDRARCWDLNTLVPVALGRNRRQIRTLLQEVETGEPAKVYFEHRGADSICVDANSGRAVAMIPGPLNMMHLCPSGREWIATNLTGGAMGMFSLEGGT